MPNLPRQIPPLTPEAARRQRLILWLAMAVSIVMYFVVMRLIQPAAAQENSTLVTMLLVVAVGLVAASFLIKRRLLAQVGREGNPLQEQKALLVALVLCETSALIGVIIRFVTGAPQYYLFILVGLAGVLLHYPRTEA